MARNESPLEELRREVNEAEGGVVLTTGERLRIAAGESRLKERARERVALSLQTEGLLAIPEVPDWQGHEVFVTSQTSDLGLMFLALQNPSEDNLRRHILPGAGQAKLAGERWRAVDELGELLDDARKLVATIDEGRS
jgi:hypothetical protein